MNEPGHPAPFHLAARAIQGKQKLTGKELWNVLRWYAHNRGYDGNKQWTRDTDTTEDAQRVTIARENMKKLGTTTMAESVVLLLGLSADDERAAFTINSPKYKNLSMAFPREVVEAEVKTILSTSILSPEIVSLIIGSTKDVTPQLNECGIKLPKRYSGSILFGQLIPRFDNRIIARCPITWASTYQQALAEGQTTGKAKQQADKYAKVPNADCTEYYEYRFARILANIRVNNAPIPANIRQTLFADAKAKGRFTKTEFSKRVAELTDKQPNNLKNYFHLTPDADQALILVPQTDKQKATGRAPYARPVLRQVVEEVLRGEDPTKPALSILHPTGENKEADGILYCLSDPESSVSKIVANRRIEEQTNNHLVRHRMLIFGRLLRDMINHYAAGDPNRITSCCVEVNRDLKEFSGLTNKEITQLLNSKKKDFNDAKRKLQKDAPELPITAGLIRKCRIAMDLNWTCPYTGMKYGVYDLAMMEMDHVVPFSTRKTNAMSALVLTYPEVNRLKTNRSGLEFIREYQGQPVPGRENISIFTEDKYKRFVERLDTKGSKDDQARKKTRKKLLLLETTPQKGEPTQTLGFTEGQLTQSSQLMRLGAQVIKKQIKHARIISIPGQVTAETRKAWKIMGTLALSTPEILDADTGKIREKEEIRNITHMHHAVDACVLGLIPLLIPQGDNGFIWRALLQRQLSTTDIAKISPLIASGVLSITKNNSLYLKDIPTAVKESIAAALSEKRVIRHVPSDMSGARLLEQYKGVSRKSRNNPDSNTISLRSKNNGVFETKEFNPSRVVGLKSPKLQKINSVIVIEGNYGIALDPKPTMIRHIAVYKQIQALRRQNGGNPIRILKPGMRIKITNHSQQSKNRVWLITSVKEETNGPLYVDLSTPDYARTGSAKSPYRWRQVQVKSLLSFGILILPNSYIGNED